MSNSESDSITPGPAPGGAQGMGMPKDDDSGPGGPGPAPRKRVSQACVPCAKRKTKCDGALPICGQCQQREIQECEYTTSRRNKRQRRGFPNEAYGYDQQMPAFEQPGMYPAFPGPPNDHAGFKQEGHPQNYSPLDALAASASQRAPQYHSLPARTPQPQQAAIPREVSTRLIKEYFDTIHPMWPILYKPMYGEMISELPDVLPPAVLFAIYAIAACIQPEAKQEYGAETPPPAQLFDWALSALQRPPGVNQAALHLQNLFRPCIENCTALTILALQQHGVAESSSAALLLGLASSMAIELKLHRAMPGHYDTSELEVRKRLWWNIFVLDKMMACEMKKPVILRFDETDTPYPSDTEEDEFRLIKLRLAGQNRIVSVKSRTMTGFKTTIQLTMIMEKVSVGIYSTTGRLAISQGSREAEATRERLDHELRVYRHEMDNSPLGLDLHMNGPSIAAPVIITNMVWMWCSLILVHRPFATFKTEQGDEENKTLLHPLDICLTCANDICDTLEEYEENLPKLSCDMIFPIYLTASTLSHINKKNGRDDPPTLRRIDLCVKWLLILGKNWKNGNARKAMLVNAGDLRPQHEIPRPASAAMSTHLNSSPQINQVSDVGRHTPALGSMTPGPRLKLEEQQHHLDPAAPADFWAYLDSFEDAEDPFYRMDAEFRELLQNQFDPHLGANGPPAPSGGQVMG